MSDWNAVLKDVLNAERWAMEEAAMLERLAAADKARRVSEDNTRQALCEYANPRSNAHDFHVGSGEARLGGEGSNVVQNRPRRRGQRINAVRLFGYVFWVCVWISPILVYFFLLHLAEGG